MNQSQCTSAHVTCHATINFADQAAMTADSRGGTNLLTYTLL